MAEEKHHQYLFGHHQKDDEDIISDDVTFTGEDTYVRRDYSAKAHGDIHDYSQTTEETDEDYESGKYGLTQKEHLDEHEKHESEESGHGHKHPIEEEEKINVGVDSKVEEDEAEEAEEKKKHHLFGRD